MTRCKNALSLFALIECIVVFILTPCQMNNGVARTLVSMLHDARGVINYKTTKCESLISYRR
jgi:hypothetical protein